MKILIIRLKGIAEVLCTTPLLRCLRRQLPGATIHFLSFPEQEDLLRANPHIDQLHCWYHEVDGSEALRAENFTHVIDLQQDAQSRALVQQLGIKPTQTKPAWQQWLSQAFSFAGGGQHLVQQAFAAAAPLGVADEGGGLQLFLPSSATTSPTDIPAAHAMGYLALYAGSIDKKEEAALSEFCRAVQHPVIILGKQQDAATAGRLAAIDSVKIYNACGKFHFLELAYLLWQSKLLLATGKDWPQMAAALQKPVITLHAIAPAVRPYYPSAERGKQLSLDGWQKHPEQLLEAVQTFLRKGSFA